MSFLRECPVCRTTNAATLTVCVRCRRSLAGATRVPLMKEHAPSWGQDLVEAARRRGEPMAACKSCGADNPERFVRCQSCRGPTKEVERPAQRKCRSCDAWNPSAARFCERCGDPMADTGDPARWRPDGCPGCWGDVVPQPGLRFCGTCGAALPATLLERRDLLRAVAAARIGGGYRGQAHPPELHVARCELVVRDDDHVVWVALVDSRRGVVDLELVAEPSDASRGVPPETPGSLARLAGWVRRRLRPEDDADRAAERARVEAFTTEDEQLLELERTGAALRARIELRRAPKAKRVDAWIEALADWVAWDRPAG